MANYDLNHITSLKHLQDLAKRQKGKTDALATRIGALEQTGAQANKIESIKVNGTAQAIGADKSVNISVPIIYAQENQPAGLKAGDMWFQIIE